jgi:hypothetical protein
MASFHHATTSRPIGQRRHRVTGGNGLVTGGDGLILDPSPMQVIRAQADPGAGDGCDGFFPLSTHAHPRAHTRMSAKYENPSPSVTRHRSVTRRRHGH